MNPLMSDVIPWMKSRGFEYDETKMEFYKKMGKVTQWVLTITAMSEFCCFNNDYWTDSEGSILNELGKPTQKGDIILREFHSGYPVQRFGYERIKLSEKDDN